MHSITAVLFFTDDPWYMHCLVIFQWYSVFCLNFVSVLLFISGACVIAMWWNCSHCFCSAPVWLSSALQAPPPAPLLRRTLLVAAPADVLDTTQIIRRSGGVSLHTTTQWRHSLKRHWQACLALCLFVCLSVREHISRTAHPFFTNILCVLPMAVARFSCGGVAVRYVFPV